MPPRDRTKRRVEPRQERALASVEAILVAAEQLLAEGGFARLTTNRLAARAGVNVALVYRYFALLEVLIETPGVDRRMHQELFEHLDESHQNGGALLEAARAGSRWVPTIGRLTLRDS